MALIHQLGLDPAGYPPTVHTGPDSTSPAGPACAAAKSDPDPGESDPDPGESDPGSGPMFRLGTDSR